MKKARRRSAMVDSLSLHDLCRFCHADEAWVVEMVEHGVLEPSGSDAAVWHFRGTSIVRAKKARRLTHDLGLNAPGVALVLELLEERDQLMRRLARLEPA